MHVTSTHLGAFMNRPLRVALLTTDTREYLGAYDMPKPFFGPAVAALLQGFEQVDGAEFEIISCVRQPMPALVQLAPNMRYHALLVPKLGWMTTGYQGCIRAVRRKLRELKPDIVHGQGTERDCAICSAFCGFPNIVTIHGNMAKIAEVLRERPFSYGWLNARLENFTLPRTGGVVCNSAHTEALVRPRAQRTWRVPNPLQPVFFQPIPKRPQGEPVRILNVGVVSPWKRQLEILDFSERLHADGVAATFEFVGQCEGSTPYQRAFLERVSRAERAGFARWVGAENADELVSRFDRSSALLHLPTEEAFGLVVAEALARNLKVFSSRTGGIPDIAGAADGAELIDGDDWDGLRLAITRWVGAGAPRPVNAAVEMENRYHPRRIAERHLEIYREVLAGLTTSLPSRHDSAQ